MIDFKFWLNSLQVEIDKLQELANQAKGQRCAAHAAHILETSEVEEVIENLSIDDRVSWASGNLIFYLLDVSCEIILNQTLNCT